MSACFPLNIVHLKHQHSASMASPVFSFHGFAQSSSSSSPSPSPSRASSRIEYCCICTPQPFTFSASSLPPNTICATCLQAARSILQLHNCSVPPPDPLPSHVPFESFMRGQPPKAQPKGLALALKRIEDARAQQRVQTPSKKVPFLDSLAVAFKTGMHCDVELVTDDGHSVRAHRVVMATKSPVFKSMFQGDSCKLADKGPIRMPDLNHNELKCLLEFLYTGNLRQETLEEEHTVHVLLLAADKYDIPFLREVCESCLLTKQV